MTAIKNRRGDQTPFQCYCYTHIDPSLDMNPLIAKPRVKERVINEG